MALPEFPIILGKDKGHALRYDVGFPRQSIPGFCKAAASLMMRSGFRAYYLPHYRANACLCAFSWHVPCLGKSLGLLLSVWMPVGGKDVTTLTVTMSAGQDLRDADQISISSDEYATAISSIDRTLRTVLSLMQGESPTFHVAWLFDSPSYMESEVEHGGNRILPSYVRDGRILTPMVIPVGATTESEAREASEPTAVAFKALLGLLNDSEARSFKIEKPGIAEPCVFKTPPQVEEVRSLVDGASPLHNFHRKIGLRIDGIAEAMLRTILAREQEGRQKLFNALFAFDDGLAAEKLSSAVSGVAFFAVLGSFSRVSKCKGKVQCSECGRLGKFQHQLGNEADAVLEFLSNEVLKGRKWDQEEARRHVKGFYRLQRSAFVHGARYVFPREREGPDAVPLWPTAKSHLNALTEQFEYLLTVRRAARLALLHELAKGENAFGDILEKERGAFKPVQFGGMGRFRATAEPTVLDLRIPVPFQADPKARLADS